MNVGKLPDNTVKLLRDSHLRTRRCENLKSHNLVCMPSGRFSFFGKGGNYCRAPLPESGRNAVTPLVENTSTREESNTTYQLRI